MANVPVQLRPSAVLLKPRPQCITHLYEPMVFSQSCPLGHTFPSSEHSSMSVRGERFGSFKRDGGEGNGVGGRVYVPWQVLPSAEIVRPRGQEQW